MKKTNYKINPNKMFSGELAFLSNMHPSRIRLTVMDKVFVFSNAEAAFHAGKCVKINDIVLLANLTDGYAAKKLGRKVQMRSDWDAYKVTWMKHVVNAKFNQNPELMEKLIDTYPIPLKETNTWNDTFWGVCNGTGQNHLGKILMDIRKEKQLIPFSRQQGEIKL